MALSVHRCALYGEASQIAHGPLTLVMGLVGTAVSAMGTIAGYQASQQAAQAQRDAGIRAQQQEVFKAKQLEQQAQESRAVAQREAFEKRKQVEMKTSTLQARAAASGGGADDPTIVQLGEDITGQGEFQALAEIYKGENRARGLEDAGMGARMTGDSMLAGAMAQAKGTESAAKGQLFSGIGSLISGGSSMYAKYSNPNASTMWG